MTDWDTASEIWKQQEKRRMERESSPEGKLAKEKNKQIEADNSRKDNVLRGVTGEQIENLKKDFTRTNGQPEWGSKDWEIFYWAVAFPLQETLQNTLSVPHAQIPPETMKQLQFVHGVLEETAKKNGNYDRILAEYIKNYYYKGMEAGLDSQYRSYKDQLHKGILDVNGLTRTINNMKYWVNSIPYANRPQWYNSIAYAENQLKQKQNQLHAQKVAAISKQQELASIKKHQEVTSKTTGGTTSGGSDEISEANKTKTTETPNKPTAKAEEKKDPDEELNDIMTMAMNLEKMQDAGADVGIVNFVARRLAQRIAALEGGPGGMSEEQFQRLPSQMRSPMAAMINRARYESAQKKRIDDYYEKTHQIPPNYVKNLDRLPNDMRKSILNNWNPSEIPQNEVAAAMKNLPKGRGYSVGNSYFDESKSKSISDTPQMNSSQPSMSYSPYGTSYQEFGNLSPGQDMSGMFGYNQTLNNMMSRTSTSPYTVS